MLWLIISKTIGYKYAYCPFGLGPKINDEQKSIEFETPIASHYAALKIDLDDQYGQLVSFFVSRHSTNSCDSW